MRSDLNDLRQPLGLPGARSTGWAARGRIAPALATLVLGVVSAAPAQVSPNGSEFQVNTYTTSYQIWPAVAVDAQGNFVVAWTS